MLYEMSEPLAIVPIMPITWHTWQPTTQQVAIAHDIGISSSSESPPFFYEVKSVWLDGEGAIALIGDTLGTRPAVPGEPPHYWQLPEAMPLPELVPAIALRAIRPAPLRWNAAIHPAIATPQYEPITEFSYTGALQTFEVPALLGYRLRFLIWGPGGGPSNTNAGGSGGCTDTTFTIAATNEAANLPAGLLWIAVGRGGQKNQTSHGYFGGGSVIGNANNPGGGGGDYAGIGRGEIPSHATVLAIAGGGGGGSGDPSAGFLGGHGGGLSGGAGRSSNPEANGRGGTQFAGGIASQTYQTFPPAQNGSALNGGNGGAWSNYSSAGGGAGYYGGSAGTPDGGGGGSGYSRSPGATLTSGNDSGPGNASSPLRPAGVGMGGQPGQTKGGDGFVRIEILEPL